MRAGSYGDDVLERINRETIRYDRPDARFNPITASDDELRRFGFPPRPAHGDPQEVKTFWEAMVEPPLTALNVRFAYYPPASNFLRSGGTTPQSRRQASRNWSGASITPRDGRMFTQIGGAWRVPAVTAPPEDDDYRSSTWIGLDGQRSYLDATLPQIGTAQRIVRGTGVLTPTTSSWVQWYPAIPELIIEDLEINPNDLVACWLEVLGPKLVSMFIINLDSVKPKPYAAFKWPANMVPWPEPTSPLLQPIVSGATAEWVMERPTVMDSEELYELPNYTEVVMGCVAYSATAPGEPTRLEPLTTPTITRMYKVETDPVRTVVISDAERLGDHTIRAFHR